jgi:hypothetical protein
VGVAAVGLALARPEGSDPVRPGSKKRKAGDLADVAVKAQGPASPITRPATSSTVITPDKRHNNPVLGSSPPALAPTSQQRPMSVRADSNNNGGGRRWSIARYTELSSPREHSGEEALRDSISSRGSWIRRLSAIPISPNHSPRSSVGPDSPSLAVANGSADPTSPNSASSPAQLAPNKLVKRVPSGRLSTSITRSDSKSQAPTLRRPTTSHQRSATLQQQFNQLSAETSDQPFIAHTGSVKHSTPSSKFDSSPPSSNWSPFFESRPTRIAKERSPARSSDGLQNMHSITRRVMPNEATKPSLVRPELITLPMASYTAYFDEDSIPVEEDEDEKQLSHEARTSIENSTEVRKRPRRSLSMNFSSPGWGILRSGSLRGKKRNSDGRTGGKRYSSAPVTTMPGRKVSTSHGPAQNGHRAITDPTVFQKEPATERNSLNDPIPIRSFQQRNRNASSPLPPLSRLSSFNVDLARLGLSSSSSSAPRRSPNSLALQTQTTSTSFSTPGNSTPTSPLYFGTHNTKPIRAFEPADRTSTLIGSETEGKFFPSSEEDEMDFQSETVYDSLRSGTSGSIRSHNAQLDSMFDESPPSAGATKSKRLSLHELLHGIRDGTDRIVEEDEGMSTPVKGARSRSSQEANLRTPVRSHALNLDEENNIRSSPPSFSLASKDFGRLSLDDEEEDEDWTRDDQSLEIASLSLPSSSLNSRRVSPSFRAALADLTHSSSTNEVLPSIERPRSNLFDWSEPSSGDKFDYAGTSPRPKTANVKKVADGRGGRAIGRKGPTALHIRSQSVPVVPDVNGQRENSKLAPKFGTWGLGAKGVSEEWDGDFEFENPSESVEQGDTVMERTGMVVPPAIQASQKQIVGHVGQIREVCLLVEDLKRLRNLGREMDLLDGDSSHLWIEAEGIIALAVPDDEDPTLSPRSPSSSNFRPENTDDIYEDYGPDAEDVDTSEEPFEVLNHRGQPTGFIYDGNTLRRHSVLSQDDDIFGAGAIIHPPIRESLRPPLVSPRHSHKASSEYARSVMETMHQHRAVSDPLLPELTDRSPNKMPFDTTSLRDLVNRASVLSRQLSELIRNAEASQSPETRKDRDREASPAILKLNRAFTPTAESASPKHLPRSQSNNSALGGAIDTSPTRTLEQRMHMMTVV